MLQLPETVTAGNSAAIANTGGEIFPTDVRSLIALHREADAAIDAAQTDADMEPHSRRAEWIYRTLISVTPDTLQEEAERLSYVLSYVKALTSADGQIDGGWLDMPELSHIAKNLTKLAKPVGPGALDVITRTTQKLSKCPEPNLKAELDRLEAKSDICSMVALYDYFVAVAEADLLIGNQPRSQQIELFLIAESNRAWAKAYLVADRLKRLTPSHNDRECYARTLINAAFAMGNNLPEVAKVAEYLGTLK